MTNATQENAPESTDTPEVRPIEGHSQVISRFPSWSESVTIDAEAIDYTWTAPTVPESIEPNGERCPARVDLTREDMFYVALDGVVLDQGPERIFVLDTNFDVVNARRLAAAILECCDRIDQADQQS